MRVLSAVVLILILSGCVSASSISKMEYLTGPVPAGASLEAMKSNLTRGMTNWKANPVYEIEAMLYTRPLVETEEQERMKRNLATPEDVEKEVKKSVDVFVTNKTCFLFSVGTYYIEQGYFRNYVAKVEDSAGKLHTITFAFTNGVESVPNATLGKGFRFHNSTVGCTESVDVTKGFKVHFVPQNVTITPAVLEWKTAAN